MTVLYGSSVADTTITTACKMATVTGGTETSKTTTTDASGVFAEVTSQGGSVTSVSAIPATPTGKGWVYSPGAGTYANNNWSAAVTISFAFLGASSHLTLRFFKYSGGSYSSIGTIVVTTTTTVKTTYNFTATSMPAATFGASDLVYIDLWMQDSGTDAGGDDPVIYESNSATVGVANDMQVTTSTFTPAPTGPPQYLPRSLGSTLVNLGADHKFVPRALGSTIIFGITPGYVPRTLGGTFLWHSRNQPQYVPRALGSIIVFPLGGFTSGNPIVGLARANYLSAMAVVGRSQEKDLIAAPSKANARATFLEAAVSKASAQSKFLVSIRFGLARYIPRVFGGTLGQPQSARSTFVEAIKEVPTARSQFVEAARLGQVHLVPRALGGTIILPSLASRAKFLESVAQKAGSRSNFLVSIGSQALSRAKSFISMRFGRILYVPRAFGGTITFPPTGPVGWSKFKIQVPGANAITGWAQSAYKSAAVSSAQARSRFFSAARFGWVRLIPRALGGTIIYPSLEAREKSLTAIGSKAPAQSKFTISAAIKGRAQSLFKSAAVSLAQVRARFQSAARFGWVRLVPRALGGTIIYPSLEAREKSQVSIGQRVPARSGFIVRVAQRAQAQSKFLIQGLLIIVPFGKITHAAVNLLTTLRGATASFVPRTLGGTLLVTIAKSLTSIGHTVGQALSSSIGRQSSLSLVGRVTSPLAVTHQAVSMAAPFSSILSTITVTDVNGALVSNASVASVLVTFPDDTISALSLGSGVTSLGSGQYQAKYNTKMPGIIREVWSITAADGVTLASAQFLVGTEY